MMKVLTLYQPWASLVALNEKRIETRSWRTSYRGTLAIHAGKGFHPSYQTLANLDATFNRALTGGKDWNPDIWDTLPLGSVIAICNLVDCQKIVFRDRTFAKLENGIYVEGNERAFGDYSPGRYAWILEDIHQLAKPIPAKGMQRIWNWDQETHEIAIDPWVIGETKIWTLAGVRSGKQVDPSREDAVKGLEVA